MGPSVLVQFACEAQLLKKKSGNVSSILEIQPQII